MTGKCTVSSSSCRSFSKGWSFCNYCAVNLQDQGLPFSKWWYKKQLVHVLSLNYKTYSSSTTQTHRFSAILSSPSMRESIQQLVRELWTSNWKCKAQVKSIKKLWYHWTLLKTNREENFSFKFPLFYIQALLDIYNQTLLCVGKKAHPELMWRQQAFRPFGKD